MEGPHSLVPHKGTLRQVLSGFETLPLPLTPPTACFLKMCLSLGPLIL